MTCPRCSRPKMQARSKVCAGCRSARVRGETRPAVPMKYAVSVWVKQQIQRGLDIGPDIDVELPHE